MCVFILISKSKVARSLHFSSLCIWISSEDPQLSNFGVVHAVCEVFIIKFSSYDGLIYIDHNPWKTHVFFQIEDFTYSMETQDFGQPESWPVYIYLCMKYYKEKLTLTDEKCQCPSIPIYLWGILFPFSHCVKARYV